MVKKYFNSVENTHTEHEYRFKTKEEFRSEFGSYWRDSVPQTFVPEMDYLFGKDYINEVSDNDVDNDDYDDEIGRIDGWSISLPMLIKNTEGVTINNYFKNKNIYESKKSYYNSVKKENTIYPYRFKTIDEMKNEYLNFVTENQPEENNTFENIGNRWRDYIDCFFSSNMDYLCGEDYEDEYLTIENGDNYRLPGYYQNFNISTQMLTENSDSPLYNMVSNKRKNIYENKVIKYNEAKNSIKEADSICIYMKDKTELLDFDELLYEITKRRHDLYHLYSNDTPIYFVVNLRSINISWLGGDENLEEIGVDKRWNLNGVYEKIYYFERDKEEIKNIITNKKIDYLPYYMKSPKNVYESINSKPLFFEKTFYRLPNNEELLEIDKHKLNANDILNGFRYTIVGRGMIDSNKKNMIIQSIESLIRIDENNMEYKIALKKAQKITLR